MKRLIVPQGVMKALVAEFGVSYPTVRAALRYATNTELAQQIRQSALQRGATVMEAERVRK